MSSDSYHEPLELLSEATKNQHRALVSLREELEAVDWYQQRAEACSDPELKAVLLHNKREEIEHAMMVLEWLRRSEPAFAEHIETYVGASGPIVDVEASSKAGSAAAGSVSLGIGSLKRNAVMDLLKRELAPITDEAWRQIDEEARRVLKLHLAGRKLVDFSGPHGWQLGAVNTGRLKQLEAPSGSRVDHALREVRPLLELKSHLSLLTTELDSAARGADDLDLDPVIAAAERSARAEDSAIFRGFPAAGISGIIEASPHAPVDVKAPSDWPRAVSSAKETLRLAGINGPYALAAGPVAYAELTAEGDDGYPLRKRLDESIDEGSLVWAPALEEGAVLLSTRGGDYELTVGQDFSVGYAAHDRNEVELFIVESLTFRVLESKAAVLIRRT